MGIKTLNTGKLKGLMVNLTTRRIRLYGMERDLGLDMLPAGTEVTDIQRAAVQAVVEKAIELINEVTANDQEALAILGSIQSKVLLPGAPKIKWLSGPKA